MKNKTIYMLLFLLSVSMHAFSQNHLRIKEVFDVYGKQEGAIFVQLSSDVLSQGSNITFYKSLILDKNSSREQTITTALKQDLKNCSVISEIKKNGILESGTYLVDKNPSQKLNEYILYKNRDGKITLVYLSGNFPPNQLSNELKKLKNLFIYINNKRLKI
ncbi:MAG: hypothetical protein QM654_01750 [Dysgonamonadaceae bacterium]